MGIIIKYRPYKVKTPLYMEDSIREMEITDENGVVLAIIPNIQNSVLTNPKKFAKELCAVMRENAHRLCHAANGEGEANGERENCGPCNGEWVRKAPDDIRDLIREVLSGKWQWCASCKTDCPWRGTDSLVVCYKFADKANGEGEASTENTTENTNKEDK